MLTTKVGETIINTIDSKYDRYQLKVWSNKGLLKCPVCNGEYEYCHGEIVSPYFRHKEKDCSGYYSEPETNEHKQGKTLLYNWIKKQPGVDNVKLEAWIPETKQRPDIYFEQNGKRYVIEYQCSPIASEYIKRRELYNLNNINDIWILGTEKYKIENIDMGYFHSSTYRTIEDKNSGLIYFNYKTNEFVFETSYIYRAMELLSPLFDNHSFIKQHFVENFSLHPLSVSRDNFIAYSTNNVSFNEKALLNNGSIRQIKSLELQIGQKLQIKLQTIREQKERALMEENMVKDVIKDLNKVFLKIDERYYLKYEEKGILSSKYKISFLFNYEIFINEDTVECCEIGLKTTRFYNYRGKLQWGKRKVYNKIITSPIDELTYNELYSCIYPMVKELINPFEKEKIQFKEKLAAIADIRELNVRITDTEYLIPKNIKFKYLKNHNFYSSHFVMEDFAELLRTIKNKKSIVLLLRGTNEANHAVNILKSKYEFKNVELLDGCIKRDDGGSYGKK